jgi:predicted DNA-binding transcriptional regulator AlpA
MNNGNADIGPITAEARAAMAARLGVRGDFVHVPHLALALGISSTTIHAQMRRGNFPIPHRKVGNVVVVKLDDYVRWFEQADAETKKPLTDAKGEASSLEEQPPGAQPQSAALGASERQRRAEFKARMQREVLENMRRKGFNV